MFADRLDCTKSQVRGAYKGLPESHQTGERPSPCTLLLEGDISQLEAQVTTFQSVFPKLVHEAEQGANDRLKLQAVRKELAGKQQEWAVASADVRRLQEQVRVLTQEVTQLRSQAEVQETAVVKEKEASFLLKAEQSRLRSSNKKETERSQMLLTTLWRVSEEEVAVSRLLAGEKLTEGEGAKDAVGDLKQVCSVGGDTDGNRASVALVGILANVAAHPEAREFLLEHEAGCRCVETACVMLTVKPAPGARTLRVLLQLLHNISLSETGLLFLSTLQLSNTLFGALQDNDSACVYKNTDLRLRLIELLHSLLLHNSGFTHPFASNRVAHEFMESLGNHGNPKIQQAAESLAEDFLLAISTSI